MIDTILGFKQKMGTVFIGDQSIPVTWVKVDPCVVTQIKGQEKDGYQAVQLGTGSKKTVNFTKPLKGHLGKASQIQNSKIKDQNLLPRFLREIRVKEETGLKVGDEVKVTDVLKKGDYVTIIGTSKGKGFAGGVKRWGFAGGPKTHGQSDRERAPGSIGQRTTPGRVYKGRHMAGRMGTDRVTVKNLVAVDIDEKNNLVAIMGAVPGIIGGLIFIKRTSSGGIQTETLASTDIKDEAVKTTDTDKSEVENEEPAREAADGNKEEKEVENAAIETETQKEEKTDEIAKTDQPEAVKEENSENK